MKYLIEEKKLNEISEAMNELEKLLTERISDLHEVKGGMQARHTYILYRNCLSKIMSKLNNSLEDVTEIAAERIILDDALSYKNCDGLIEEGSRLEDAVLYAIKEALNKK